MVIPLATSLYLNIGKPNPTADILRYSLEWEDETSNSFFFFFKNAKQMFPYATARSVSGVVYLVFLRTKV